jgi:hypothetical protein
LLNHELRPGAAYMTTEVATRLQALEREVHEISWKATDLFGMTVARCEDRRDGNHRRGGLRIRRDGDGVERDVPGAMRSQPRRTAGLIVQLFAFLAMGVFGANMGGKLVVALQFEVPHHFIKGIARGRA